VSNPQNEAVLRRMLDILTQPNAPSDSELSQLITPDWYNNDKTLEGVTGHPLRGYEGFKELYNFWTPFSDLKATLEDIFSDGDWVASHFKLSGRHTGDFMGMPPTGKSFEITATGMFKFQNGKVVENIVNPDALGLLMQLGVVQMPTSERRAA
jgi:predicted ester cyclase